jgi:hypothetical protein
MKKDTWWLAAAFVGLVIFMAGLYGTYAARFPLNYADSDDLTLAGYFGGLAHPPGYPFLIGILNLGMRFGLGEPYHVANLISGLLQAVSVGLLMLVSFRLIRLVTPKLKTGWAIGISVIGALIFGLSKSTWTHGTVIEVFPLAQILVLLFWLRMIGVWRGKTSYTGIVLTAIVGAAAVFFHPLNAVVVGLGLLMVSKPLGKLSFWRPVSLWIIFGLAFVVAFGSYRLFSNEAGYRWPIEEGLKNYVSFYLRLPYGESGSAVETYTGELNLVHSAQSLLALLNYWLAEYPLGLILIMPLAFWTAVKRRQQKVWYFWGLWLLLGPGLVAYMKMPIAGEVFDLEYYWGSLLRWRMFYLANMTGVLLMTLLLAEGLVWLGKNRPNKAVLVWPVSMVLLVLVGITRISQDDLSYANAPWLLSSRVIQSLPNDSVLVVSDDAIFSLYYQVLVEQVDKQVTILPVNLNPLTNIGAEIPKIAVFGDENLNASYAVAALLANERRVFVYMPDSALLSFLGVEGNPYYAIPHGYVLEIAREAPEQIEEADFGLSVQLTELPTKRRDYWQRGLQAKVGTIHAQLGYYTQRLGAHELAYFHHQTADGLSFAEPSKAVLAYSHREARSRYQAEGSYWGYEIPSYTEYLVKGEESLTLGEVEQAEYFFTRAILREPYRKEAYERLAIYYQDLGEVEKIKEVARLQLVLAQFNDH